MANSFGQRIKRTWRHLTSSKAEARQAFPPETLNAIAAAITAGELTHRGEVRVVVEKGLPLAEVWDDVSNRQRALDLFGDFGVWDTEDNCGVLIYINLAEHKIDIVADRGIDRKIEQPTWQAICHTMSAGFKQGQFHQATLAAIEEVNALLRLHFPADGSGSNELPDHPIVM